MHTFWIRSLRRWVLAGCLGAATVSHGQEITGLLGTYSFADHGSMHFRAEPLLEFLRLQHVNLQLDVSNTYDELLLRALRHDYVAMHAPAHFALYLQRCCGYRIVAGWQGSISALLLKQDRPSSAGDSNRPQTVAVASMLALVSMAMAGGCRQQFAIDGQLHELVSSGTHERALQALLRGKVDRAIVSSTALRALNKDLRARLQIVKTIDGLPADVIVVNGGAKPAPAWQIALEKAFPTSAQATEFQHRWHRPQGVLPAKALQLQAAEAYTAQIDSCMQAIASAVAKH